MDPHMKYNILLHRTLSRAYWAYISQLFTSLLELLSECPCVVWQASFRRSPESCRKWPSSLMHHTYGYMVGKHSFQSITFPQRSMEFTISKWQSQSESQESQ